MAAEQNHKEAEILASRAGISVPPERIPALAAALSATKRLAADIARHDFGAGEPASRFRAPLP